MAALFLVLGALGLFQRLRCFRKFQSTAAMITAPRIFRITGERLLAFSKIRQAGGFFLPGRGVILVLFAGIVPWFFF